MTYDNIAQRAIREESAKYNGWTNYATWRVNLEIFDGGEFSDYSPNMLREFAEEIIYETSPEGLARDYALAFLSDVNWYEIAEAYNEQDAA